MYKRIELTTQLLMLSFSHARIAQVAHVLAADSDPIYDIVNTREAEHHERSASTLAAMANTLAPRIGGPN